MQLAQLNIGVTRYDTDDPRMAGFMDNLNRVNEMAARMPGFVWNLKDESGHAMNIETPFEAEFGPRAAANMTVWETREDLERFVWRTVHKRFHDRRHEWFEPMDVRYNVMWWIENGHRPTLPEAKARLDHLRAHGNTDHAFSWAYAAGTNERGG